MLVLINKKYLFMRKHLFLIVIISIATAIPVQSQFQLGIKGGFHSTHFNTDNAWSILKNQENYEFQNAKDDMKNGFTLGAYARIGLIGGLSLQPELYYSEKSGATTYMFEERVSPVNQSVTENMKYYSWDIPILLRLKVIDLKLLNLYALTGPVASFKAKDKSSFSDLNDELNCNKLKSTNWNFQLGGGVEVWRLNLDVRYEWGMSDISKTELIRKGNSLMFSLGFRLIGD